MIRRNVAGQPITLGPLLNISDGSPVTTGASIFVAQDGVDQGAGLGTLAHWRSGVWFYTPTQGETNCALLSLSLEKSGAAPVAPTVITTYIPTQTTGVGGVALAAAANGDVRMANAVAHGGATATLELGATGATAPLYVHNTVGNAVRFDASSSLVGNGLLVAGGGSASGLSATGTYGITAQSIINGNGIRAIGAANNAGLVVTGGDTSGNGIQITAGSLTGTGIVITAASSLDSTTLSRIGNATWTSFIPVVFSSTILTVNSPTSFTLQSNASSLDNAYLGCLFRITNGVGNGESPKVVTAYNGATRTLTVSPAFVNTITNGTTFTLLGINQKEQVATIDANVVSVADGAITDAAIAFPPETTGRATTFLAAMRRVWEWAVNKKTRNRSTGDKEVFGADGKTVLETQVQSSNTVGNVTTDQETQGA